MRTPGEEGIRAARAEAAERIRIGNYPTCDECGEQHSQDVDCSDWTERIMNVPHPLAMTEDEKNEPHLDQLDDAERGTPTGETIDITPRGCETPEGNERVNHAIATVDSANARVADIATQMVDRLAANQQWDSEEHNTLKEAVEYRRHAYETLLRAVAGR